MLKRRLGRVIPFVAVTFMLAVLSFPATSSAKVFRWRMQHPWTPGSIYDVASQNFVKNIKKMSDGRLQITMFTVGSLMGPFETFDAISKGAFEGHINIPVYHAGKMPVSAVLCFIPGAGFMSEHDLSAWYTKGGGLEIAREAYAKFGLYFVGVGVLENMSPLMTRKKHPIRTLADLKGLKVRATPGLMSELVKAVGASPTFMAVGDAYTSLETGVIDAVAGFTSAGWYKFGVHEIASYMTWPSLWIPAAAMEVVVNQKAWDKLPPDIQAIFEIAISRWHHEMYSSSDLDNLKAIRAMKAYGLKEFHLPEADVNKIKAIGMSIADKYAAKDPMATKAWNSQKAFMRRLGILK